MRKDRETFLRIHLERKQEVLSADFNYEKVLDGFFRHAAREGRFVNGADIETIVDSAFCTLFANCSIEELEQAEEINASVRCYTQDEVINALKEELSSTRSYFDNNLQSTALYWMEMTKLNFRDAGDSRLLDEKQYIPSSGLFRNLELPLDGKKPAEYGTKAEEYAAKYRNEEDYDKALRYTLAAEIRRQVCLKGGIGP